jgi:hypothetical protein
MAIVPLRRLLIRLLVFLLRPLWTALWLRPAAATHLRGTAADLLRSRNRQVNREEVGVGGSLACPVRAIRSGCRSC